VIALFCLFADAGFHVRTGAECNPGACYSYLGEDILCFPAKLLCSVALLVHWPGWLLSVFRHPLMLVAGVEEKEVEVLAGEKEGCDDDVEFVRRQVAGAAQQVSLV